MESKPKIVIATQKNYFVPKDKMYVPVLAGSKNLKQSFKNEMPNLRYDDDGKNISDLNPRYCELTVAYWAAKNLDNKYIGLCHYRRFFKGSGEKNTLTSEDLKTLLSKAEVVLPKKRHYGPFSVWSHYSATFNEKHLQILREIIAEKQTSYLKSFDKQMKSHSLHICNMFIMSKKMMSDYLEWLFDILFEVEKQIDFSKMNDFEKRVMGRLAERLLDVWIDYNNIKYIECPTIDLEGNNLISKFVGFGKAKFLGKTYKKSY